MGSRFVSAALALMVVGATAAAQAPSPASSVANPKRPRLSVEELRWLFRLTPTRVAGHRVCSGVGAARLAI